MKILLINPPAENTLKGNNPPIIDEERGYNPPLGLLYIAGYLEKHSTHQVKVLDTQVEELSYEALDTQIRNVKPDIVGITAMTFTLIDALKTAKVVKNISKDIKIILGGPHVFIYPEETISLKEVDFLILGEGEVTFSELVDNIDNVEKLKEIKGLVFKSNGNIYNTGLREFITNLDEIPHPARHLVPYKKYTSLIAKRQPITTMITSRGCPYNCSFCARPHLGKRFRARSAKNVVQEMQECVKLGINEFLIYDDTFSIDRQRVLDICDEIIAKKLDIGWDIRVRVDTVDEEMLKKLKQANCERIHYGVEAGTEKILKVLRKGITLEQVKYAFDITKKIGISTLAYFMIGSPTETKEDILHTIEFAKKLNPDFVHITITTPFPATAIYKKGLEEGIIKKDFWHDFALNPDENFQPQYFEENLTSAELIELIDYAYKSFYTRPTYILKELFQVKSFAELKRKVKAGLKVAGSKISGK
ncbi:MAG: radical SAM protein [bacterium]